MLIISTLNNKLLSFKVVSKQNKNFRNCKFKNKSNK